MNDLGLNRKTILGAFVLIGLTACGRPLKSPAVLAESYLPPPEVENAVRGTDGTIRLSGHAGEGALIQLRSPDGGQATARAGQSGAGALTLPPAEQPRLYAFEAVSGNKTVRSEGALAVMPASAPAALTLRAGFAAEPIGQGANSQLRVLALDYDGGGLAAGGVAPPHTRLRLAVDGVFEGETEADGRGRFALLAVDPNHHISEGVHAVKIYSARGQVVDRSFDLSLGVIPDDRAFIAQRTPIGWAVTWRLPGGGSQTSQVFDDAANSAVGRAP